MTINLGSPEGQAVIHKLIATADVFMNNLRPYEMETFQLTYEKACEVNPKIIILAILAFLTFGLVKLNYRNYRNFLTRRI